MRQVARWVVVFAVLGATAVALAQSDRSNPYPSEEVATALARLSEPSVPRPLPGDASVAIGWHRHGGSCDEVRTGYEASGAPIPADATTTVDAAGNVQVDASYGPAAVILGQTRDGNCDYAIEINPTLEIEGLGVRETASFVNVVCAPIIGRDFLGAQYETDSGLFYVAAIVGDSPDIWKLTFSRGLLVDALNGKQTPGSSTEVVAMSASVAVTDRGYILDGQGPQGPVHVETVCTPFQAAT